MDSELLKIQTLNLLAGFPDTFEFEETENHLVFKKKEKASDFSCVDFWNEFCKLQIDMKSFIFGSPRVRYQKEKNLKSQFVNEEGDLFDLLSIKENGMPSLFFPEFFRLGESIFIKGIVLVNYLVYPEWFDDLERYKLFHSEGITPFLPSSEENERICLLAKNIPELKDGFIVAGVLFDASRLVTWGISKEKVF